MNIQLINFFLTILLTIMTTGIVCSQNLEINLCDDNGDGYSNFNIEEIENYVLQTVGAENDYFLEEVLISTSNGNIYSINSPSNNPNSSLLCNLEEYGSFTDIAINSNQEIFLCGGGLYSLDEQCDIFAYNYSFFQNNSLSFDDLDNLYLGYGTESYVYRFNIPGTVLENFEEWHDFGTGTAGGDFVLLNNKMYISWKLSNDNYRLYAVTVNDDRDYISHIDLGQLPNETYGLASELGKLFGVTPNKLFQIDLNNFTFTDIIQNSNPQDKWYGAAGRHEAIVFITSTHITLDDAQNNINEINRDWTNTVVGGQTIYIRIENSLTGEYDIIPIDIIITTYPNVNQPINLEMCYEDTYNIFDLTQVSMQINGNDNLSFTYYNVDPEVNPTVNPILTPYQSTQNIETLFVSVEKNNSGCNLIYNFQVINNVRPNLLPLSDIQSPTLLENCYFDQDDIGYFNLNDIENDIILDEGSFETSYYLSYLDAETSNNQISEIYYLQDQIQEIFIKVTDENGCVGISNFYLELDCFTNNESLTSIVFPKFITPNNDGINDFWNIKGVSEKVKRESTITIFNRYGKLLYTFKPYSNIGWNGTYNGLQLPSSDYWFLFTTNSGINKTGHFTLKR